jgi:probable HAF family extracellular repeat protein
MPTYRSRPNHLHGTMLVAASCLVLSCSGDSLNEPQPHNPEEPDNPEVPALPARTDLGTLGGASSYAYDINEAGVVVGRAQTADGTFRGFRWTRADGLESLPPLSGDLQSRAIAIAEDNTVLGFSISADETSRPVLWSSEGTAEPLEIPAISGAQLTPNDRNAQGIVVGDASFPESSDALVHAWVWSATSGLIDLADQLDVQFESYASAVGDAGHVVGTLGGGLWRAYIWSRESGARSLGIPGNAPNRTQVTAVGVNGLGQVAGWAELFPPETDAVSAPEPPFPTFGSHGYVWTEAGGFTLLPGFGGDDPSGAMALDLNERGDVVGSATPPQGDNINAVAWPRGGAIVPLNGSDLNTSVAFAVNSTGLAVGWSSTGGEEANRATVWNIDLASPLTAQIARPGGRAYAPGRVRTQSRGAGCLERGAVISKLHLAECLEGRTN